MKEKYDKIEMEELDYQKVLQELKKSSLFSISKSKNQKRKEIDIIKN